MCWELGTGKNKREERGEKREERREKREERRALGVARGAFYIKYIKNIVITTKVSKKAQRSLRNKL
jgi:hypothetical protein